MQKSGGSDLRVPQLVYQAPWYRNGVVQGLVELSLEIPESMPHFVREG